MNACQRHFYDWKMSGQECRAGFEGRVFRDPDFVESPYDQRKQFFLFWRLLFVGPQAKVMGALKLNVPFLSGPATTVEQTFR